MTVRPLSESLQLIAERELNELPSRVGDDLTALKNWLRKVPHLKARSDDQSLITFLRSSKYRLERTKHKIEYFYSMKTLLPEFFGKRDPFSHEVQQCFEKGVLAVLPFSDTRAEPLRILVNFGWADPDVLTFEKLVKVTFMLLDILLYESDVATIAGIYILVDLKNLSHKYSGQLNPITIRKALLMYQNAYPARPKSIHVMNTPSLITTVYEIVRPWLPKKLVERMHFYTGSGGVAIYEYFHPSVLPIEYGGEGKSVFELADKWKRKLEGYQKFFISDEQYGCDQIDPSSNLEQMKELFGIDGSFRKLNID